MNIGKLNRRLSILSPPSAEEVDEAGQPHDEWQPVTETWAAVEPLYGRELFRAQQLHAEVTTRIRIRYRRGINRTMKCVSRGIEFEILYIIEPEFGQKELQLMCKEVQ